MNPYCRVGRRDVVRCDGHPHGVHGGFIGRAAEEDLERGSRIALSQVSRVDGVPDLDNSRGVGRPVEASPPHGDLPLIIPDNPGHQAALAGSCSTYATHTPDVPPVLPGEVLRQRYRTNRVRRCQVPRARAAKTEPVSGRTRTRRPRRRPAPSHESSAVMDHDSQLARRTLRAAVLPARHDPLTIRGSAIDPNPRIHPLALRPCQRPAGAGRHESRLPELAMARAGPPSRPSASEAVPAE